MFHDIRAQQEAQGLDPWAPFADTEEWGLVKWLVSRVGQNAIDEFMKLPITSRLNTSFTSKYTLMKAIDQLPRGTEWQLKRINVEGNKLTNDGHCETEDLELWLRDPVDCICELMANPEFDRMVSYAPERVFADAEGKTRRFDEMWTGNWWWEMQGRLPQGAVVAPFRGDQEVWPVYLTLGNISKEIRSQPSKHAAILIAYLPISKLECFTRDTRSVERYRLFHYCMTQVLEPLVKAGKDGVDVTCPDRQVRRMHPVVAAYVADFPEQCLVACSMENRCPKCVVGRNECGDMTRSEMRNRESTLEYLRLHHDGEMTIYSPFWATLPHNDIFSCITPDILHQLHKGVFKDHLVSWCSDIIGEEELDAHFKAMTSYSGLRHFKKEISKWKQWTGADYRELQRVFLGVIAGAVNSQVLAAVRGVLDFVYYAQYQTHTDVTLSHMHSALASFHANKHVFLNLGVREHFNIPKIDSMLHYIDAICLFGSADGFNTELPERLHIDFAKHAYRASNRRDYVIQMTTWLQWQESIAIQDAYLRWWASQHPANDNLVQDEADSSTSDSDSDGPAPMGANHIILPCQAQRFTMLMASQGYFVPRRCPFPNSTIQRLLHDYGTALFIPALEDFLRNHIPKGLHRKLTPQDRVLSPVRAAPVIPSKDARKGPAPAHFDTVLVIEDEDRYTGEGMSGLRVGEVMVIFDLPSRFGHFPHPLAYIHWFRPLQAFDDNLQFFRLMRSSRQRGPNAAILPVNRILRPCHLVPRFS
ncbi:hypothetical protein DFJ58DRAFT_714433 [Suillus subalutaceus]|uniref:uncharacterized protein n=1 Tax=Suillus subalutaceus TaxID=48586 RepID=UPI001B876C75|nr:uncharacterized protein DFJ58DRAFT_714433 [Suillus subalutaceus]KAG1867160.1 hypothetical protein DFJ58DRAFT_714433 [Suillus subalutaceus]